MPNCQVQNIIPGSLPHNLVCYNCVVALHPNKLKHIAPGRPYYGIKDEHGATFCSDSCLVSYLSVVGRQLGTWGTDSLAQGGVDSGMILLSISA